MAWLACCLAKCNLSSAAPNVSLRPVLLCRCPGASWRWRWTRTRPSPPTRETTSAPALWPAALLVARGGAPCLVVASAQGAATCLVAHSNDRNSTLTDHLTSSSHCPWPCREAPPLTVAAVHVKTVLNPSSAANEVVAASVVYLQRVRTDGPMSQVHPCLSHGLCAFGSQAACYLQSSSCPLELCSICVQVTNLTFASHLPAGGVEQRGAPAPFQRAAQAGQPALPRRCFLWHTACALGWCVRLTVHSAAL